MAGYILKTRAIGKDFWTNGMCLRTATYYASSQVIKDEDKASSIIRDIVGEKHDWGVDPFTGQERQGRWIVARQDIKNAFNSLVNGVGSNQTVNNDLNVIKGHLHILGEAIIIDCISRLTKAELHDAEDMLNNNLSEIVNLAFSTTCENILFACTFKETFLSLQLQKNLPRDRIVPGFL